MAVSTLQNDEGVAGEQQGDIVRNDSNKTPLAEPKKKKKNRGRTAAKRGPTALSRHRGTGFEEYFADPPMTPTEAVEEKHELYASNLSFEERMQTCLHRFRSRRRLQGEMNHFFDEYIFLGGVDSSPVSYTGVGADLKHLTPAERQEAKGCKDVIYGTTSAGDRFYNGDKDAWTVDFTGVAAGFFSVTLLQLTSFEPEKLALGVQVVENFLRYVLHHDVCPEYADDVKNALKVCDDARVEWPMVWRVHASFPGQFNLAAMELFDEKAFATGDWSFSGFTRPEDFDAKAAFYSTLALLDDQETFKVLTKQEPQVVIKEYECTLEVVEVLRPSEEAVKRITSLAIDGHKASLVPIGKATFKPAVIEDSWEQPIVSSPTNDEELYFDDSILKDLKSGFKATMVICELNVGFKFVKAIRLLVPTFYTFLPQELMRHYKELRENDRSAPSVQDPDAEEGQFVNATQEG